MEITGREGIAEIQAVITFASTVWLECSKVCAKNVKLLPSMCLICVLSVLTILYMFFFFTVFLQQLKSDAIAYEKAVKSTHTGWVLFLQSNTEVLPVFFAVS